MQPEPAAPLPQDDDDAVFQYLRGQQRPQHAELLQRFEREGEAAVERWRPQLDLRYGGEHPRQAFDLFRTPQAAPRGTLLYFHAGYWQARDKAGFRFLAPAWLQDGWDVALANYPLCPEVSMERLLALAAPAVGAVRKGHRGGEFVLAGHSAGAQMALELVLRHGATADRLLCLSGVYDLRPLRATPLNRALKLDAAAAERASPLLHARQLGLPAHFVVGADETPAFRAQNAAMAAAWAAAGNPARALELPGADHFTLLAQLTPGFGAG